MNWHWTVYVWLAALCFFALSALAGFGDPDTYHIGMISTLITVAIFLGPAMFGGDE
jgi:uncharacterized membrane protein